MITYASKAQLARAYLFREYNDIDVYVEDTTCQNLWLRLLRAIGGPTARIEAVFPLAGKTEVLRIAAGDQTSDGRPRIYLVDGDLDLLTGKVPPGHERLYVLPVYCVENLILLERAILEVATDGLVSMSVGEARGLLAPRELLERSAQSLAPLFVVYAVAYALDLRIDTVTFPVQRLCSDVNDAKSLSRANIHTRIRQVVKQITERAGIYAYRRESLRIKSTMRDGTQLSRFISGKRYLLPLIHIHLRKYAAFQGSQDQLKTRLARHYDPDIEPRLADRIRSLLPSKHHP